MIIHNIYIHTYNRAVDTTLSNYNGSSCIIWNVSIAEELTEQGVK